MANDETNVVLKQILDELVQVKRILVFQLIQDDYKQSVIAEVLRVSQPTVSRDYPAKVSRSTKKPDE